MAGWVEAIYLRIEWWMAGWMEAIYLRIEWWMAGRVEASLGLVRVECWTRNIYLRRVVDGWVGGGQPGAGEG
jgi:hypothetical protein